jgi:hypothetical protein
MLITLLSLAVFALLAGAATVYAFVGAKGGHEDEQGFHALQPVVAATPRASRLASDVIAAQPQMRSMVSAG